MMVQSMVSKDEETRLRKVFLQLDIDGDGLNDVMVGAPGSSKAYLYMGSAFSQGATLLYADAHANIQGVGFG